MTFDDLEFTHVGCCGTHRWAEATHSNGLRTDVYDHEDGTYSAVTWCGQSIAAGRTILQDAAAVTVRLAQDAARSI